MGFRATIIYGSTKNHYPWLKCHENEEKIENYHMMLWKITMIWFGSIDSTTNFCSNALFAQSLPTPLAPPGAPPPPGIFDQHPRYGAERALFYFLLSSVSTPTAPLHEGEVLFIVSSSAQHPQSKIVPRTLCRCTVCPKNESNPNVTRKEMITPIN